MVVHDELLFALDPGFEKKRKRLGNDSLEALECGGSTVKAIVLARLKKKDQTSGNIAPPVRIKIVIVSESCDIPRKAEDNGEEDMNDENDKGKKQKTFFHVERAKCYWYSAFFAGDDIQPGCLVVLDRPRADTYKGRVCISGRVNRLERSSWKVMQENLPEELFDPPKSLGEFEVREDVCLRFGSCGHEERSALAFTRGFHTNSKAVYSYSDATKTVHVGAYVERVRGYPTELEGNNVKILMSTKLYERHAQAFGIVDVDTWVALAPLFFDNLHAVLFVNYDSDATHSMLGNLRPSAKQGSEWKYVCSTHRVASHVEFRRNTSKGGVPSSAFLR